MRKVFVGLASGIWSTLSQAARLSVRMGATKSTQLEGVRVISVGNIQVGGAGKTPLVAQIANEAIQRGHQVCILSRGYRSIWESEGGIVLPGAEPADAGQCGDEAALLHDLCPQAYIGVGANRVKQFYAVKKQTEAHARAGIDLVILDDGFQHWRVKKDVEVVALTSAKPTEILFRDSPRAVEKAHLLVWTKGDKRPDSWRRPMAVVHYTLPNAQNQSPYWLVTGVADSGFVFTLATRFGYRIARHIQFGDHAEYNIQSVQKILKQAAQNQMNVLLTGKDWVKWRGFGISPSEVTVLEPKLVVEEGRDHWSRILWGK